MRNSARVPRILLACFFPILSLAAHAQSAQRPLRVAIVGLVHDHVVGFLAQLPQHHDVELVGIVEPDPALQAKDQQKFNI